MKISLFFLSLTLFFCFSSTLVFSADSTGSDDQALAEVIEMMTHPGKRAEITKGDPKAQGADRVLKQLGQGETEKLYQLAAKVFEYLVTESKGNIDQVEETLKKAQNNPEAFFNQLSPELKNSFKDLTKKIEKKQNSLKP